MEVILLSNLIIPHHGYHIKCLKFGQRKNTGYPVFCF